MGANRLVRGGSAADPRTLRAGGRDLPPLPRSTRDGVRRAFLARDAYDFRPHGSSFAARFRIIRSRSILGSEDPTATDAWRRFAAATHPRHLRKPDACARAQSPRAG